MSFQSGERQFLQFTLQDITERKRVEQALKASEERHRLISRCVPDIVFMYDFSERFTYVSSAVEHLHGRTIEETLQLRNLEWLTPEQRIRTRNKIALELTNSANPQYDRNRVHGFESEEVRKDGSTFWAEVRAVFWWSDTGKPLGIIGTISDLTERNKAQAAQREQAALLEASHDAVIVLHIQHGIQYMNPAAEKLTGQTLATAKSKPLSFILHTRNNLSLTAAVREVSTHGKWAEELTLLTNEGKPQIVASRWIALKDTHGNPASILITCNDITEQKQLQAQYLRAQRLESVGTLASGVAHDLNNILCPILMGVDLLEMTVTDAETRESLAVVKESARRGTDTVKQLLTFARGADTQKGPVQPRHLLKEISRLIQQTFPKTIQIYSDFTGHSATVLADPSQLHQVLMNLCVNARDAMPEGGVLFMRLENITLDETTSKQHPKARPIPYVVFKITDSGTGIPPEIMERIFDPFFTTKPQGKGTGLGLSTVLGIVENHDGFVQVESQLNQGTTFQIFLPAAAGAMESVSPTEPSMAPRGQGEWVLVVDDEPAIVRTVESVLRKAGYQTMSANNASEAIHLYQRNHDRIKAVFTDVMMPFGDGRQLIMMLYEQDPKLPLIAMSGLSSLEIQKDLQKRGASRFLSKPFTAEQLLTSLAQALQSATMNSMLHHHPGETFSRPF